VEVHSSSFSACKDADALVIATEWPEFAMVDLTALAAVMGRRIIMDARNMIDPAAAVSAGFRYSGIGVPVQVRREEEMAV
jgi:UDPglucose 6-dehydrogenase